MYIHELHKNCMLTYDSAIPREDIEINQSSAETLKSRGDVKTDNKE